MTDRNASIVDENIQTPPSPIDTGKAGFERDLVGDVENIGFNFCTGGTKAGFCLFNGFLIAIKRCDGSIASARAAAVALPIPLPPPVMTATSPSRRKRSSICAISTLV